MSAFFCYVVRCADGSLYTGWTTDLQRRLQAHNSGRGAKYTRSRRPVRLVYAERCHSRGAAMQKERQIKALSKSAKEKLVASYDQQGINP